MEAGPIVAGFGSLLLLVALFLDWYDPAGTAWEVFEVWDVVLAALALLVLYVGFEHASGRTGLGGRPLLAAGLVALAIVISQLLSDPPAAAGADKDTGIWLALAGVALMALGGILSSWRISVRLVTDPRSGGETRATEPIDRSERG